MRTTCAIETRKAEAASHRFIVVNLIREPRSLMPKWLKFA